jgi:hypothetical protein
MEAKAIRRTTHATDRAHQLLRLDEPTIAHTTFEHPAACPLEKAEPADRQPALGRITGPCPARLAISTNQRT